MTEQNTSPVVEHGPPSAVEASGQEAAGQEAVRETAGQETAGPDAAGPDAAGPDAAGQDAMQSGAADVTEVVESGAGPATGRSASGAPATSASALEREGEVAADFLEQLLDIADMDGDIDVDVDGDRAAVAIVDSEEGRVSRRLVGPDGKVLEALQELTRLAVQAATGERSRLMLDVAGYRAERRAAVVSVAKVAIAAVRSTNEKVAMDSMSAFERKVVHDEVLAAGLISESEGMEPQRHVVILPA